MLQGDWTSYPKSFTPTGALFPILLAFVACVIGIRPFALYQGISYETSHVLSPNSYPYLFLATSATRWFSLVSSLCKRTGGVMQGAECWHLRGYGDRVCCVNVMWVDSYISSLGTALLYAFAAHSAPTYRLNMLFSWLTKAIVIGNLHTWPCTVGSPRVKPRGQVALYVLNITLTHDKIFRRV